MKHEFYTCDSCGAKLPQKQRLAVRIDRRMDAAGDMEDEYEHVDLCFDCLRSVSEELLKDMPKTAKQEILRKWRRAVAKEADGDA